MRKLGVGRPAEASAGDRRYPGADRLTSQVQSPEKLGRTCEGAEHIPVFSPQVDCDSIAPLGVLLQRSRDRCQHAPLFPVPAKQRYNIDRLVSQVIELGINGLKGESAKDAEQCLPFVAFPAIALPVMQPNVELAVVASFKIETGKWKNAQAIDASLSSTELGQFQGTCGCESKGAIEQPRIDTRFRIQLHRRQLRLSRPV